MSSEGSEENKRRWIDNTRDTKTIVFALSMTHHLEAVVKTNKFINHFDKENFQMRKKSQKK